MSCEEKFNPIKEPCVSRDAIQDNQPPSRSKYSEQMSENPVVSQPRQDPSSWINIPTAIPDCPPGLEYLAAVDQLLVKQKIELFEAFTGFETNNKFVIKNAMGQNVFWAVEDNDCCNRNCCGPSRSFDMRVFDASKREVMHFSRPCACAISCCCIPCCPDTIEVSSPPGNIIGRVDQEWSICFPQFSIKNHQEVEVLRIEGPLITASCCCNDVDFYIATTDGTEIGKITKQWSGFGRETFTDADHFNISFPLDLNVRMKAVLLGACILMDMRYFEHTNN